MNKRGQALVEFILVLPVLLLIVFAFIDFGKIMLCKSHLENVMDTVILLDDDKISSFLSSDDSYRITYNVENGEYRKITLTTSVELITPGLKSILTNPYTVNVERSVLYE